MRYLKVWFLLFVMSSNMLAQDYICKDDKDHVIHILTLDPRKYEVSFVKANNKVFGRETIQEVAERTGADIAVNAGFFEIGGNKDGMPSGIFISNGEIFGFGFKTQDCLIYNKKSQFMIESITPNINIKIGSYVFKPKKINKFQGKNDIVWYTSAWGTNTLTSLSGRQEIIIDHNYKVLSIQRQGDNVIPNKGFVLSLPADYRLSSKLIGSKVHVNLHPVFLESSSVVTGIPVLVKNGKVSSFVLKKNTSFYSMPHARTAIGINKNSGKISIVVVEHAYFSSKNQGVTLKELANLMIELDCDSAINLDGGGSSSLFVNKKVINTAMGDQDEGFGQLVVRPISTAIVFKRVPHVSKLNHTYGK